MVVQSSAQCAELFAELCEILSHRGRSSLTVVSGVLDDLVSGCAVGGEGLKDAQDGAANLLAVFDTLRTLGRSLKSPTEDLSRDLTRALAAVKR